MEEPGIKASLAFCSFSGGKDSCLALLHARRAGLAVETLVVMMNEQGDRTRSHGIPRSLVERQARALSAECVLCAADWNGYEAKLIETLRGLHARGHTVGVFGDIDVEAHRAFEEQVCAAAGMRAYLPLWQRDRLGIADEFMALGFRARVVCVDSRYLGDEFCGREYDARFVADLPAGVDACGENGEFHTFVYDGPGFSAPVPFAIEAIEAYVAPAQFGGTRYCMARLV